MTRVPGDTPIWIQADPVTGTITLTIPGAYNQVTFTAVQSEHLRTLLQAAEYVVETGVGTV